MFAIKFNRFQHSAWAAALHSGRYELMNILTFIVVKLDTSHLLLLLLKNHHNHLSHFQFSHLRAASEREMKMERRKLDWWCVFDIWYRGRKNFLSVLSWLELAPIYVGYVIHNFSLFSLASYIYTLRHF